MKRCNKDGSVLIVVLLVLAAAAYLIMESGKFLRIDYSSAAYQRTITAGGSLLRSGLFVAEELLMEDLKDTRDRADHKFDNWVEIDKFYDEISASLVSGDLSGAVVAENGLINLNKFRGTSSYNLQLGEMFKRLVAGLCEAHEIEADPKEYLASIKVWLGDKDTRGDKSWYGSQEPGYALHGKEFVSPDDLLLVHWRDVEPEDVRKIYYGEGSIPGLKEFVTVWGDGKINPNIAPKAIIAAFVTGPLRAEFVERVETYRNDGSNNFANRNWCSRIANDLGVTTGFPADVIEVSSNHFRVSLTAKVGAGQLNSTTIIRRDNNGCVVLFENIH